MRRELQAALNVGHEQLRKDGPQAACFTCADFSKYRFLPASNSKLQSSKLKGHQLSELGGPQLGGLQHVAAVGRLG